MRLFRREEITIRCAFRGATLSVPSAKRLIDRCAPAQQHHLRRELDKDAADDCGWTVEWRKETADPLHPRDVVAVLRRAPIVVELAAARSGMVVERLVADGAHATCGARLARLGKPPTPIAALPHDVETLLRHFVARQRDDAETIKRLEGELLALHAARGTAGAADRKFRRLKHEFSKRFHPDACPAGDAERPFRERVFQEFWPIVEEIERS